MSSCNVEALTMERFTAHISMGLPLSSSSLLFQILNLPKTEKWFCRCFCFSFSVSRVGILISLHYHSLLASSVIPQKSKSESFKYWISRTVLTSLSYGHHMPTSLFLFRTPESWIQNLLIFSL